MDSVRHLIIGAGISGLATAAFSREQDYLVLEADREIGGYCKTIKQDGFTWDYSGHFFHFKHPDIEAWLRARMPEQRIHTICGTGQMCMGGACVNACTADGVDLVYVVDEQNDFMSFDPRKLPGNPFTVIGTLSCPTTGASIQTGNSMVMPFSMSVDRDGVAWVLYTNGQLFKVSLQNASCMAAGNTVDAGNMALFGMGFSTDMMGGDTEKLYMAGGNNDAQATPRKLAYDDTHGGNLTPVAAGTITASPAEFSPELTGTSEAKLYGFFPNLSAVAYVQEISKTDGSPVGMKWNLGTSGLGGNIRDWAFAQWGGTFYMFVTTTDTGGTPNSTVRAINRMTGTYSTVLQNLPYLIDGAGVSTCAPVSIQ